MNKVRPSAEALIIVDVQRGFIEGPQALPGAGRLVEKLSGLLGRARQAGALVVHLQNDGQPGAADEPGTPGWELYLPVAQSASEVVIRKSTDDGFAGTGLGDLLDRRGVRRLVIGGLLSEMCVSATARTALARGLAVVLPRDAHGTYDLADIPAAVVARVAEHALGDAPELVNSVERRSVSPRLASVRRVAAAATEPGVNAALLLAVFVSNLPEAVGSATDLRSGGHRPAAVMRLWVVVAVVCVGANVAGYALAEVATGGWSGLIYGFAAGVLLVMLIDSMIPAAARGRVPPPGWRRVVGFAAAFGLSLAAM